MMAAMLAIYFDEAKFYDGDHSIVQVPVALAY